MCRMIIAAGEFDISLLLDGFIKMAEGKNEKHERNQNTLYNHPDGWGIAYLAGVRFRIYKKEMPVWEDAAFGNFRNIKTNMMILHARRSSVSKRAYENTQPFYRKFPQNEYVFCHNGTVSQSLNFSPEFYPIGETDSEILFFNLLSSLAKDGSAGLLQNLFLLENYSAANIILADKNSAYIAVLYKEDKQYYTMKIYSADNCLIISSEILPGFDNEEWVPLTNKSIVELNFISLEYSIKEI